ncbi:restriction endonuclease [Kocuria salina]|uniref:restriction endonuclease n=1 Tax=Kocuria salina TaxID=1929416 RepID=UPI001C3D4C2B|nr:restriction endonuclease [Kocuria salina]
MPSIYDEPATELTGFFYTPYELEVLLKEELLGRDDLYGLPVRTRSKVAKTLVCEALGYVAPKTFQRVNPRLSHINADVYAQESNNLQIWNQEVDASRRYIILILIEGQISNVKVIAGADLAQYDTTGTLTRKYQANRINENSGSRLVSQTDSNELVRLFQPSFTLDYAVSPVALPEPGLVLDIATIYSRLQAIVGRTYIDPGLTQERNRGSVVHRDACELLGLSHFADNGQFPDVLSQLLEVKLQLARTVDLGLELPESTAPVASTNGILAARDMRYAIFYAARDGAKFTVTELVVVTGKDFFKEFRQFQGRISNSKLQLRLPGPWFN